MSRGGETGRQNSHAIITGGSSGIGLATACLFASRGLAVSLIARNVERLEAAKATVTEAAGGAARVATFSADVGDAAAVKAAVDQAVAAHGPPAWAVACAGIVHPGPFLTMPLEAHEEQTRTNYFGSLHFAHAVAPHMIGAGGGRMVFISSGAAFLGIYGYSSYGPSKFAVRGLAEALRVELRPAKIDVTLVFPPDTNTPQLRAEKPLRPAATSTIVAGAGLWEPGEIAKAIVAGAERGRFTVAPGWKLHLLNSVHSMIAPAFRAYQHWVVKRHDKA